MNEANLALRRLLRSTGFAFCDDDYEKSQSSKSDLDDDEILDPLIVAPVAASSSDHPEQSIDRVLQEDDTFWSSEGTNPLVKDVAQEYLTFKMKYPLNLVKSVVITVYRAVFQIGGPIYPPETMTLYTGPSLHEMKRASKDFKIQPHDWEQEFDLPFGQQTLGQYIQFRFQGKQQMQREDNRYYIAIRHLDAWGVLLEPISIKQSNQNLETDWPIPRKSATFLELSHHYFKEGETIQTRFRNFKDDSDWWMKNKTVRESTVFDFPQELNNV